MASKKATRAFAPYKPPVILRLEAAGGGPTTPASSLLHRMGKREVDEEVVAVVAWTLSHFRAKPAPSACWDIEAASKEKSGNKLIERIEKELLDDLGLEWQEDRMGFTHLVPKAPAVEPLPTGKKGAK